MWRDLLQVGAGLTGYQNPGLGLLLLGLAAAGGLGSLIAGAIRLIKFLRAKALDQESIVGRSVEYVRRGLIPLMLGVMAVAGVLLLGGAIAGTIAYLNSTAEPTTTSPAKASAVSPLIKNPTIQLDGARVSLRGRYARAGTDVSVYVTYGQTGVGIGQAGNTVMGGKFSLAEPRIKIDTVARFDRDEATEITLGEMTPVEGNQVILQWGKSQLNNKKVGITWGSYFGFVILVDKEGREDSYPFAIISRSQASPSPPIILSPDFIASYSSPSSEAASPHVSTTPMPQTSEPVLLPVLTPRPKPKPSYGTDELTQMRTALRQARDVLDQKYSPALQKFNDINQRWERAIQSNPKGVAAELVAVRDVILTGINDINMILYDNRDYTDQLHPTIFDKVNPADGFNSALSDLINDLNEIGEAQNVRRVFRWVYSRHEQTYKASTQLGEWIGKANHRIGEKTKELREWKND